MPEYLLQQLPNHIFIADCNYCRMYIARSTDQYFRFSEERNSDKKQIFDYRK